MDYQLRPAVDSDGSFLYALHCATMRDHIDRTWGWDETWQRHDFDRRFREQDVSVIDVGNRAAGGLWLESRADSLYVADLQLLPEFQNRGIGTAVLKGLIARAASRHLPVALAVLPVNEGARRLYERLGFKVTDVTDPFVYMRCERVTTDDI